jgi:hypothetical protein
MNTEDGPSQQQAVTIASTSRQWEYATLVDATLQIPLLKFFIKIGPHTTVSLHARRPTIMMSGGYISRMGGTAFKYSIRTDQAATAFMQETGCLIYRPINRTQTQIICRLCDEVKHISLHPTSLNEDTVRLDVRDVHAGAIMGFVDVRVSTKMSEVTSQIRSMLSDMNIVSPQTVVKPDVPYNGNSLVRTAFAVQLGLGQHRHNSKKRRAGPAQVVSM